MFKANRGAFGLGLEFGFEPSGLAQYGCGCVCACGWGVCVCVYIYMTYILVLEISREHFTEIIFGISPKNFLGNNLFHSDSSYVFIK